MSITIQEQLAAAVSQLADHSDSARLDAELLLGHVLQKNRTWLHTWPETELTESQHAVFTTLLERRRQGEPIAHILGHQEFWSLGLAVTPATLIPRPDTERLVELALERIPPDVDWSILDLGTGSGAIALALAAERPRCQVTATDKSPLALEIARQNAARHQLQHIDFIEGDWLQPLASSQLFDMIVSNPPYVCEQDPHIHTGDLRYEPKSALIAGPQGLDDILTIARGAWQHLKPGGWLLLEHGFDQREAVRQLLVKAGYVDVQDYDDYAGNPRVAVARLPQ